jgi:hypothetical protein
MFVLWEIELSKSDKVLENPVLAEVVAALAEAADAGGGVARHLAKPVCKKM